MLKELLAGEVFLLDSLCSKLLHDLVLCSDGSMVGTRHPARILAVHPCLADKNVVQCIVEHMAHMQDSCHVWRRNHDCIRFSFVRFRMEKLVFKPIGIPFILRQGRIILCWKFHISI